MRVIAEKDMQLEKGQRWNEWKNVKGPFGIEIVVGGTLNAIQPLEHHESLKIVALYNDRNEHMVIESISLYRGRGKYAQIDGEVLSDRNRERLVSHVMDNAGF